MRVESVTPDKVRSLDCCDDLIYEIGKVVMLGQDVIAACFG
jgi:hypothetical protein